MDSQAFDPSRDPILAFTSEAPVVPQAAAAPPTFADTLTWDAAQVITPVVTGQPSRTISLWFVATICVALGVVVGFAGGYVFAQRVIAPAVASAPRNAPTGVPPVPRGQQPDESSPTPTDISPVPPDQQPTETALTSVIPAVPPVAAGTTSVPSEPSSTTPVTTSTPRPAAAIPATADSGAIEVVSRPQGAQVFIDGRAIGQAPLSIPDVAEGTHDIRLELAGFNPWVTSVRVSRGGRTRVGASLAR